jgi:hypothetical protein
MMLTGTGVVTCCVIYRCLYLDFYRLFLRCVLSMWYPWAVFLCIFSMFGLLRAMGCFWLYTFRCFCGALLRFHLVCGTECVFLLLIFNIGYNVTISILACMCVWILSDWMFLPCLLEMLLVKMSVCNYGLLWVCGCRWRCCLFGVVVTWMRKRTVVWCCYLLM